MSKYPVIRFNSCEHKHLGVTLSKDSSWNEHIKNIISSTLKVLNSMKILKFKLKRATLNQIYISYLRAILEYASIVWDNCTLQDRESLEKIQYEAARIVTGLTLSVSTERLLTEIGWVSLSDRRVMQKLILMYKNENGQLQNYLSELFPPNVHEVNPYDLRSNHNYVTVQRRLEIFSKSVIPSSVKLWNEFDINIRYSSTLFSFKLNLKNYFKSVTVPVYFLCGERTYSVLHARIRNQCSNLNGDL